MGCGIFVRQLLAECDQVSGLVETKNISLNALRHGENGGMGKTYEVSIRRRCELLLGICTRRRV